MKNITRLNIYPVSKSWSSSKYMSGSTYYSNVRSSYRFRFFSWSQSWSEFSWYGFRSESWSINKR